MIMFEELVAILCDQLPLSPEDIRPESKIKDDLGADSLDVLQLLMALEEEKGVVIPDDVLPTLITVGDIVAYMESQQ
ncbi:MAG: acyl carrier protein [Oscillospiraceae bacterium]|nr:acyl carrier protein [Oscillospiraceae bacterium]